MTLTDTSFRWAVGSYGAGLLDKEAIQEGPGDEFSRMAYLIELTRDSAPRRIVQRLWERAVVARNSRREEILFDHLWPGVF